MRAYFSFLALTLGFSAPGHAESYIDLSQDKQRHVVIEQGTPEVYQGHPTTVLLPDGKTMFATWSLDHGGPCGPLKRSDDGGKTWSELLEVPESWRTTRNCPAIYRLVDPQGKARLIIFAGQGPGGSMKPDNGTMHRAVSEDDGKTWSSMESVGLECVMPFCTIVPVEGGKKLIGLTNMRRPGETEDKYSNIIVQSESVDGGLTWSSWKTVADEKPLRVCEPEVIQSPDGKELLLLMRENLQQKARYKTSRDEGQTWGESRLLPQALVGDRHKASYAPDGRLVICFRDRAKAWGTANHFVAWVGRYEDIPSGQGTRLKLLHSNAGYDCGYPGVECLPDGTVVATTYVKYKSGEDKHSIVSTRFKLEELDSMAPTQVQKTKAAP